MERIDLTALFSESFAKNGDLKIFSDYKGQTFTYGEVARMMAAIHCYFDEVGLQRGDKVALLGRNSSHWGISFLATLCYGAVVVPILPDFNAADTMHILNHSEAKFLFLHDSLTEKVDYTHIPEVKNVVSLAGFAPLYSAPDSQADAAACLDIQNLPADIVGKLRFAQLDSEEVCAISYTSGTSGFTKGVMIPARSIWSNIIYANEHMPLKAGDRLVSFLPMAHVFGFLFDFLWPVGLGCHITFLTKPPTPQVIVKAFEEIRPNLILTVPLVIEKIYKKNILPTISKPAVKVMLAIPGISAILRKKIKAKLVETFGGEFHEIVIGGAPLSKEVEDFFRSIRFPFSIGYGMTECGPLISYENWDKTRASSAGRLVDRMELRIDSEDPYHVVGEIMVRGMNTMLGYYKNEEATRATLVEDGWLRTGDLGVTDANQFIYIRGRSKNMLLGPSGQNIYPEELEAKLSNMPYVQECVVVDRGGKLTALIYPEKEAVEAKGLTPQQLLAVMNENRVHVNRELPKYEQIASFELVETEFEKTPKRNIKRYLYQ